MLLAYVVIYDAFYHYFRLSYTEESKLHLRIQLSGKALAYQVGSQFIPTIACKHTKFPMVTVC